MLNLIKFIIPDTANTLNLVDILDMVTALQFDFPNKSTITFVQGVFVENVTSIEV